MDSNVNYTVVGAFVILLVAAIVMSIIWLSSGFNVVPETYYLIYSQESVSGLSLDSPVEYNGVKVGTVQEISIVKNNPRLVKVLLSIKTTTPITQGTVATLTSRGLTGVVFIALKDVGNNLEPLIAKPGYPYPVIPTTPSLYMRLDSALRQVTKSLQTVSQTFKTLFDQENLKSIKNILNNMNQVTLNFANNTEKINRIIDNTTLASSQFSPLLRSTQNAMRTLEMQTMPATYRLMSNLDEITRNLAEVSLQLKQNPSVIIRGTAPLPPGPGERRR
jgi:phospholipid/cholesterol/gamma-HCH transport system substrate-binding protein